MIKPLHPEELTALCKAVIAANPDDLLAFGQACINLAAYFREFIDHAGTSDARLEQLEARASAFGTKLSSIEAALAVALRERAEMERQRDEALGKLEEIRLIVLRAPRDTKPPTHKFPLDDSDLCPICGRPSHDGDCR